MERRNSVRRIWILIEPAEESETGDWVYAGGETEDGHLIVENYQNEDLLRQYFDDNQSFLKLDTSANFIKMTMNLSMTITVPEPMTICLMVRLFTSLEKIRLKKL